MAKIELTNEQLRLIQNALELYSRVGIMQIDHIMYHPTVDSLLYQQFTSKDELKVGDSTMRGDIVEIGDGFIKTKGSWGNGEEIKTWEDVSNVKRSPDWGKLHEQRDLIKQTCSNLKNMICGDYEIYNPNASYGIHSPKVDNTNREAFDIIQVIRHEFWKKDEKRSNITVDSYIHPTSGMPTVKVEVD